MFPESAIGAVYCADDDQIDAQAFARGLGAACLRRGVRVYENTAVLGTLRHRDTVIGVRTVRGELHANGVVWATGAWSVNLRAEGVDLPIETVRIGQLVTQPVAYKPGAILHGPRGVINCGALTDLSSFDPEQFVSPALLDRSATSATTTPSRRTPKALCSSATASTEWAHSIRTSACPLLKP